MLVEEGQHRRLHVERLVVEIERVRCVGDHDELVLDAAGGLKLMFEPKAAKGKRAMALSGPDGRFTLYRQGMGDRTGAIVGEYVVRVYAADSDDPDAAVVIPERYARSSTLEFEVKPGQPNSFEINLESP